MLRKYHNGIKIFSGVLRLANAGHGSLLRANFV
jgi:hypothetical protein